MSPAPSPHLRSSASSAGNPVSAPRKPSGVPWLGDIPSHWEVKRLRFVAKINPPSPVLRQLSPEDEVSFVPMESIGQLGALVLEQTRVLSETSGGYTEFQDGDIVLAKITPCFENGKAALAKGLKNGAAYGTTELHVIRAQDSSTARFLFYLSISDTFKKIGESEMYGAGGQKRVPPEFIKDFPIPLPPLHEQRAIADFLDARTGQIDRLVERKRTLIERLREKRAALIARCVTRGLTPAVPLRPSGIPWLGDLPAHWEVKRLKFLIHKIEQGWSPQCDGTPAIEGEWGVLKTGCVNDGVFSENDNKRLPDEFTAPTELEVNKGDLVMSRANGTPRFVGAVARVHRQPKARLILSDKLFRLSPTTGELDPDYFSRVMGAQVVREQIELSIGGAQGLANNITIDDIRNLWLPAPPLAEQTAIAAHLDRETGKIDRLITRVETAVSRLLEYRSALITAAVTGKIDTPAARH